MYEYTPPKPIIISLYGKDGFKLRKKGQKVLDILER